MFNTGYYGIKEKLDCENTRKNKNRQKQITHLFTLFDKIAYVHEKAKQSFLPH